MQTDQLFFLLFYLQIKHVAADFVLQPLQWQKNKHIYLSGGGAKHALIHAGLTGIGLAAFPVSSSLLAVVVLVEWVIHFHIDWAKAKIVEKLELSVVHNQYWWLFGLDQCLHQLTYLGIALFLVFRI